MDGFDILKVKVGLIFELDFECIKYICFVILDYVKFCLDVN